MCIFVQFAFHFCFSILLFYFVFLFVVSVCSVEENPQEKKTSEKEKNKQKIKNRKKNTRKAKKSQKKSQKKVKKNPKKTEKTSNTNFLGMYTRPIAASEISQPRDPAFESRIESARSAIIAKRDDLLTAICCAKLQEHQMGDIFPCHFEWKKNAYTFNPPLFWAYPKKMKKQDKKKYIEAEIMKLREMSFVFLCVALCTSGKIPHWSCL